MPEGTSATIENPVINSPYVEPVRNFVTIDGQVTGEIEPRRRSSEFFVPVARPKKASQAQLTLDAFGPVKQQPNEIVNEIRQSVERWRTQQYPHITATTRDLLDHWRSEERERRLFFCQIEAAETAIYLTEAAEKIGDTKALNVIRQENQQHNGGLPRMTFKMATGSGKTVLMAMLIAWQALNKQSNPQDRRFSDKFLIVTPGITIRDRLRVLIPNDPGNYYRLLDILTPEQLDRLQAATVEITNFHAFLRREKIEAAEEKVYVVQTPSKLVARCLLMTTDPADLVLDPTCGSGTTAYVAEQWGRRWITIDTSRVALALARSRLMAARFPYYLLADSEAGIRKEAEVSGQAPPTPLPATFGDVRRGFVYERVPHVTLKSIAQNPEIRESMSRERSTPRSLATPRPRRCLIGRTRTRRSCACRARSPSRACHPIGCSSTASRTCRLPRRRPRSTPDNS